MSRIPFFLTSATLLLALAGCSKSAETAVVSSDSSSDPCSEYSFDKDEVSSAADGIEIDEGSIVASESNIEAVRTLVDNFYSEYRDKGCSESDILVAQVEAWNDSISRAETDLESYIAEKVASFSADLGVARDEADFIANSYLDIYNVETPGSECEKNLTSPSSSAQSSDWQDAAVCLEALDPLHYWNSAVPISFEYGEVSAVISDFLANHLNTPSNIRFRSATRLSQFLTNPYYQRAIKAAVRAYSYNAVAQEGTSLLLLQLNSGKVVALEVDEDD